MYIVMAICMVIVLIVLFLSVITTSKAYQYKHTIDPAGKDEKSSAGEDNREEK
ncbi:YtzI protein [Bacillus lacus]|uniref:YtzI protein n=1 Tax=Metabacillus lacus TaxID=1983721 RepID=A0A7X2IZ86_9BACI|nr:YtzI protein [Metabacillus lacus]MRX72400.1 YtzI protein [Metabacillus lacus]